MFHKHRMNTEYRNPGKDSDFRMHKGLIYCRKYVAMKNVESLVKNYVGKARCMLCRQWSVCEATSRHLRPRLYQAQRIDSHRKAARILVVIAITDSQLSGKIDSLPQLSPQCPSCFHIQETLVSTPQHVSLSTSPMSANSQVKLRGTCAERAAYRAHTHTLGQSRTKAAKRPSPWSLLQPAPPSHSFRAVDWPVSDGRADWDCLTQTAGYQNTPDQPHCGPGGTASTQPCT